MADNWFYNGAGGFTMVGTIDSAWYCRRRYDSSGEDKDIQTEDTAQPGSSFREYDSSE